MSTFHVTVDRRQQILNLDIREQNTQYGQTNEEPLARSLAEISGEQDGFACAATLADRFANPPMRARAFEMLPAMT